MRLLIGRIHPIAIVGIGIAGGTFCGSVILFCGELPLNNHVFSDLLFSLLTGGVYGGVFGAFAFPACYYAFLRGVTLAQIVAVTIPATILAGLLGLFTTAPQSFWWFAWIYGPGFIGLLLSSIWLAATRNRPLLFQRCIAVILVVCIAIVAFSLARHNEAMTQSMRPNDNVDIFFAMVPPPPQGAWEEAHGFSYHFNRHTGDSATYQTSLSGNAVLAYYRTQLRRNGWRACSIMRGKYSLTFRKGHYLATINYYTGSQRYDVRIIEGEGSGC